MTFFEAKGNQIEELNNRLSELINEQREKMRYLLKKDTDSDFLFFTNMYQIGQREDNIIYIHNSINKLKEFDTLKIEVSKIIKTSDGGLTDRKKRIDFDLKTDGNWMKEKECTKEQMWEIFRAIYNKDKNLFFDNLLKITDNKNLTHRYTKHIFGTSIKHK